MRLSACFAATAAALCAAAICLGAGGEQAERTVAAVTAKPDAEFLDRYCMGCHNQRNRSGGVALDSASIESVAESAEVWEKVVRKLRARAMPPAGRPRPDEQTYSAVVSYLEEALDRAAAANPDPGRPDTLRRLNRTEYRNAIRDLLALDVDVESLLPKDDASHGFDNVAVGSLSPTLLDRYLAAAQKIRRLAIGYGSSSPCTLTILLTAYLSK
jgi:hypothetical protein